MTTKTLAQLPIVILGMFEAARLQLAAIVARLVAWFRAADAAEDARLDLSYRALTGVDLSAYGEALATADLTGADLRGADLDGLDLSCAILVNADLREARLYGTDLAFADLTGVILRETEVDGDTALPGGWENAAGYLVESL